jgi:5-methylcytosine-specific restriction endonuclease McrA
MRLMGYTDEELSCVFDKNNGYCWHCGKKLAWKNYGKPRKRGAWEVDHSRPLLRGGTDYLRNLVPACIECNRSKGDLTSQELERY